MRTMNPLMLVFVIGVLLPNIISPAYSLTKLQSQQSDFSDPCASMGPRMTTSGMFSCAMDAIHHPTGYFEYEFKWMLAAAEHFDKDEEYQLANMYARRGLYEEPIYGYVSGLPAKNLVEAYKWA